MDTWVVGAFGLGVAVLANVVLVATSLGRMGAKVDLFRDVMTDAFARIERNHGEHVARNERDNAIIFERMDALNQRLSTLEGRQRGSDSH